MVKNAITPSMPGDAGMGKGNSCLCPPQSTSSNTVHPRVFLYRILQKAVAVRSELGKVYGHLLLLFMLCSIGDIYI